MALDFDPYNMVVAVNSLNDTLKETNILKDYILPFIITLLTIVGSAFLGYVIAVRGYRWQSNVQLEREKIDAVNRTFLTFQQAFGNVIAMKENYYQHLQSYPIQRALNLPVILFDDTVLNVEYEKLVQLLPNEESKIDINSWLNIGSIVSTVKNYNQLLKILAIRNAMDEKIKGAIADSLGPTEILVISGDDLMKLIGRRELTSYIDLTEICLTRIDNILIELFDFLNNYPLLVEPAFKKEFLLNYRRIIKYKNDNETVKDIIKRMQPVDIKGIVDIMQMKEERAMKRYHDFRVIQSKNNQ